MRREVVVVPDRWSPQGEVELMLRGQPMRIWSGIPGEKVRVKVTHSGQNRDYAMILDVLEPHPHRVDPPCDRFHLCGGCPLMHLSPEGQRIARRKMVLDAFAEEGLRDVSVGDVQPSPDGEANFRHSIKLGVGTSDHGRLRIGAWARRSRDVVPIPGCVVATPTLRRVMGLVAHHVIDLNLRPYDPREDTGVLRSVLLRQSRTDGTVLVTLVAGRRVRELSELANQIGSGGDVSGVALHLNSEPGNAIFKRDEFGAVRTLCLGGRPWVEEELLGVSYRVGAGEFFQTNPAVAERIYGRTLDRLELQQGEGLVDLYCGVGGFALPGARITGWALGVEEIEGAVEQARESARRNKIPAEFVAGQVRELLPDLAKRVAGSRPAVVVNPARRGLEDGVIDGILGLEPRRIAYISCNARALARDLRQFREAGLSIGHVELFDMFPNTAHVEAVALIEGKPSSTTPRRRAPRRKVVEA